MGPLRSAWAVVAWVLLSACSAPDAAPARGGNAVGASTVPTDPAALFDWLEQGSYTNFSHETKVHESAGPHAFVKVFLDESLQASLSASAGANPVGAAAIKELYDAEDGPVSGWAVAIKTGQTGTKDDWFWYERRRGAAAPSTSRSGAPICASCHESGRDYIVTEVPLR